MSVAIGAATASRAHSAAMKHILLLAAVAEAATGIAFLIAPSLVGQWLLGTALTGVSLSLAQAFGIPLVALALACWPGSPLLGMLTYGAGIMLYLAYGGLAGSLNGVLLWPAVGLHLVLTLLLVLQWKDGAQH
jgi:hypothetical protein